MVVKKIKNYAITNKEIVFAFLIFIFFLTIFCFSPISGDDWGNYMVGARGLKGWIGQAISMYFDWEGRFISRLLINMLTYNKWLWNIINALFMSVLYLLTVKLINPKKISLISILFILSMLLIGNDIFTQTYTWIAGSITYLFPLTLTFIYLFMINCYIKKNALNKWYVYALWFLLNLIIPMFVENMGVTIIVINVIMIMYVLIVDKRLNKLFLISLGISLISFLIMIMSPGTATRMAYEASSFSSLSFIDKIFINLPNFIKYTIAKNNLLLLFFPLSYIYLTFEKIKNLFVRGLVLLLNILPFLTIILNIVNSPFVSNISILEFVREFNFLYDMNIFVILFWILYLIGFFILLIINFKGKPIIIFYFILAIVSNGVMLLSPVWGSRTALFTVFMLIVINIFVLSEIVSNFKKTKLLEIVGKTSLGVIMIVLVILYYNVYLQNNEREKAIIMQVADNSDIIKIEGIPNYAIGGIDPYDEYHIKTFKGYYHIPEDKELIITPYKYKYFILYK
jgi:hypothetical protein